MDLRRIKKNIQSRKWESKSMKTNIDYIKKQTFIYVTIYLRFKL